MERSLQLGDWSWIDLRDHPRTVVLVERAARAVGAPVLVGAVAYEGDVRYNDMVVWTPGSGAGDYYRKHRPVPFAEYIPLRGLVRRFSGQVDRIGTDMAPGTGPQTLTVRAAVQGRDITLAMGICFEVAYDDVLRKSIGTRTLRLQNHPLNKFSRRARHTGGDY